MQLIEYDFGDVGEVQLGWNAAVRMWRAFLGQLDARGRLRWEHVFIDGSFASAKKGL